MKKRRVVFFGGKAVGYGCLRLLYEQADVRLVVSNTSDLLDPPFRWHPSLYEYCEAREGLLYTAENNPRKVLEAVRAVEPELIFVAYYDAILPPEVFRLAPMGAVNLHLANTNAYRGAHPTVYALLDGAKTYGVTLHWIDEGMDTGPVIAKMIFQVTKDCTGRELYAEATHTGVNLFSAYLPVILAGDAKSIPQTGTPKVKRRRDFPTHEIEVSEETRRKILALTFPPFPPPFIQIGKRRFVVTEQLP